MKNVTFYDFKKLREEGGSWLHVITQNNSCVIYPGKFTETRINVFIDSLIQRLEEKNIKSSDELAQRLKQIQKPIEIWHHEFVSEEKKKSFWGGDKIVKTAMVSTYLVFKNKLSQDDALCWNMWVIGYFTKPCREAYR